MKKIIAILAILCLWAEAARAQNYYPGDSGTVTVLWATYQYKLFPTGMIALYNSGNRFTGVEWNAPQVDERIALGATSTIEDDNWSWPNAFAIVNNAFSPAQKAMVQGKPHLFVNLRLDPASGRVVDVYFEFSQYSPFVKIPPAVYNSIETELKKKLWYNISAAGKRLNYVIRGWDQEISLTTPPTPPTAPQPPRKLENTVNMTATATITDPQTEKVDTRFELAFSYPLVFPLNVAVTYEYDNYEEEDGEWVLAGTTRQTTTYVAPPGTSRYGFTIFSTYRRTEVVQIYSTADTYCTYRLVDAGYFTK